MNISFTISELLDLQLTADDYTICMLIKDKKYSLLKKYVNIVGSNYIYDRVFYLQRKGYLNIRGIGQVPFDHISVSHKIIDMLSKGDLFEELYNKYPTKVTRPDGNSDYLRRNKAKCKILYQRIIKNNVSLHNHIIKCLEYEINLRTNKGSMGFFKRLENYIKQEDWKTYEDNINSSVVDEKRASLNRENTTYGNNIL